MKIKWEDWDSFPEFTLIETTCLWLEVDPMEGDNDLHPKAVLIKKKMQQIDACYRKMKNLPKYHTIEPGDKPGSEKVTVCRVGFIYTREELIAVAEKLGERPKFLYLEVRETKEQPPENLPQEEGETEAIQADPPQESPPQKSVERRKWTSCTSIIIGLCEHLRGKGLCDNPRCSDYDALDDINDERELLNIIKELLDKAGIPNDSNATSKVEDILKTKLPEGVPVRSKQTIKRYLDKIKSL